MDLQPHHIFYNFYLTVAFTSPIYRGIGGSQTMLLNSEEYTMKARAVICIDLEIQGGFKEAAKEQEKIELAIEALVKDNPNVTHHQVDVKERRGDKKVDITQMKFRNS
jgi:hypothetical protein